ncbi:sigma-w pathway protein ysdB [Bacillus swezeyi]|uniref:Sigma-w pathway protein ysdB n=1 Tax=Bacillus swezeyi TaxID=1925020 RepID=A0A1R1RK69_9BACI|nr:sigma-w pathway protein ysdB [Bacillus swezeyi]MEC1262843.1 sigma-w pathway protein ysdB [Bacillus swezeyi]MED1740359.1 sigma-w pathway protein ysdB [Bacillus swezeyi]MED2928298.1 sigma-w pathway protein ysdB [Bacillus swezeyi]MED2944702.1 sigma-w pathway protein ysdB [Bacillus swezeyi]MED2966413.1 sigma-w pathway protein ysdB [Bacillus swezeyi]
MLVIILRLALLALLIYVVYKAVLFLGSPKRRLKSAQAKEHFYFLDEQKNTRKNFKLTFKGVLFEGEKHIPAKDHPLFIHTIFVWTDSSEEKLGTFTEADFNELEERIKQRYPDCKIDWDSSIQKWKNKKAEEQ